MTASSAELSIRRENARIKRQLVQFADAMLTMAASIGRDARDATGDTSELALDVVKRVAGLLAVAELVVRPTPTYPGERLFAETIAVRLLPSELHLLAHAHEAQAGADERGGDTVVAASRRERAQQLVGVLGVGRT